MNKEGLNHRLRQIAVSLDMCESVREKWDRTLSPQQLINLWYENYDFALQHHFPSNSDIKECFSKEILRENNIIVDDRYSIYNPKSPEGFGHPGKAVILGASTSNIRANGFYVGTIWVRDKSEVNVIAKGHADITVCVMDEASVNIKTYDDAKVLVMKYSPNVTVYAEGENIRCRENYKYV